MLFFIPALVQAGEWHTTTEASQVWNEDPQPDDVATWSGDCVDGKASGSGEETWTYDKDGQRVTARYVGEKRAGKIHGQGTFYWANGNRYEGQWQDNNKHGQGTFYWANGDRYQGQYINNLAARGIWIGADGTAAFFYQKPDGSWVEQ